MLLDNEAVRRALGTSRTLTHTQFLSALTKMFAKSRDKSGSVAITTKKREIRWASFWRLRGRGVYSRAISITIVSTVCAWLCF